ncbi:MAG: Holliday junction branch migration protein RuvA [bacterium]
MIAHLKGALLSHGNDSVVLDVAGVGYEVFVSGKTLEKLKSQPNPVSVLVYTAVREDNITLFGFLTSREKQLFLRLISVSGIGPKLAVNILSGIPSDDLIEAIYREDLVRLTSIPGVGKKTAERMIVELKDKLLNLVETPSLPQNRPQKTALAEDVLSALVNLGYNRNQVEKMFERIKIHEKSDFEQALKESLQALSKA